VIDARHYAVNELLRDGGSIRIRAIRPDDKERLVEMFGRLSPRSIYFRFFNTKKGLTEEELRRFTELDFVEDVGLVATLLDDEREHVIAVGRYMGAKDGPKQRAEVAFVVVDEHQRRGVGTLLLEHLARIARDRGITEFEADVLGENNRMMEVFIRSGLPAVRSLEGGVFHLSLSTAETPALLGATHTRERAAAAQSLRAFLEPQAVAVVGASANPGTIGGALITNLVNGGFTGALYPVNPRAAEIAGLRAYPSVSAIGAPVDLAIVAVPAGAVREVVADCARAHVRGIVVVSAGFAETSRSGKDTQRQLREFVRASGMRMVGPNCIGVLNTDPAVRLNATFAPTAPPVGNLGMLSQSGALGLAALDFPRKLNLGLSTFVSVGNKADVSGNDLLAYWNEDPRTEVIALYLESFGNPRKFARVAPEVARRKPIVAVKSGRSVAGTRAATSHSAALASPDVAVDALFEQAGVIRVDTLEQLFDVAALLATQPVPVGPRVGVVTNAGGPAILLADACEAQGLELPLLAAATVEQLKTFLPPAAGLANPIDMIAAATPEQYARAIETVGGDPNVDALVVMYIPVLAGNVEEIARAIADGAGTVAREKPILAVVISSQGASPLLSAGPRGKIPAYAFPENAALALAAAHRYGRWRRRPTGTPITLAPLARTAIRAVVDRVLAGADGPRWLDAGDVTVVLRAAGLELVTGEQVAPEEAAAMAEQLGYPLVAKAVAPGLVHKSDIGGVILGLHSADDVRTAVDTLGERLGAVGQHLEAVLLQRQVAEGIEAFVGVSTDRTFGPLIVCGLGGVFVELLKDVAFRLPPVTDLDAAAMIDQLRTKRLLDGYRGAPPGDRAALEAVVQRVSAVVELIPELTELDLNPIKVLPPGAGAIVVDARIRVAPPEE
jgi:acetate---CoA ligase (ADP-forming)